jgi:hypothetical protein
VVTVLETVAEIVDGYGGEGLERLSDAVELGERLLDDAAVPPWTYATVVRSPPPPVATALRAVHAACGFHASVDGAAWRG